MPDRATSAGVRAHDICGLSSSVGLASGWQPSYRCCPRRQRGESSYPFEDRSVQPTRDRHLRHLEGYVLGMPNHFGPDLDQLLPQGRHRPRLHGTRQDKPPQKVAQVVRQGEQLQSHMVVHEVVTGKLRPLHRVLTLANPLFCRTSLIVKSNDPLALPGQVRHDEADPGEQLAVLSATTFCTSVREFSPPDRTV